MCIYFKSSYLRFIMDPPFIIVGSNHLVTSIMTVLREYEKDPRARDYAPQDKDREMFDARTNAKGLE